MTVRFNEGDKICVEKKTKNKRTNKWKSKGIVYISIGNGHGMRYNKNKKIEVINFQKKRDKGLEVSRVQMNILDLLKEWDVGLKKFIAEFKKRIV